MIQRTFCKVKFIEYPAKNMSMVTNIHVNYHLGYTEKPMT